MKITAIGCVLVFAGFVVVQAEGEAGKSRLDQSAALLLAEQGGEQSPVLISPQTLLLGTEQSGSVVVHVAIPYSQVDCPTVALDGVAALSTGADSRGDLVASFDEAAIKAIVAPPSASLTLTGNLLDQTPFAGSDTVRVIPFPG